MNQNEKTWVVTSFVTVIVLCIVVVIVFLIVPQDKNNFVKSYNTKTKLFNDNNFIQQQIYGPLFLNLTSSAQSFLRTNFMPQVYNNSIKGMTFDYSVPTSICTARVSVKDFGIDYNQNGNPNLLLSPNVYYTNFSLVEPSTKKASVFLLAAFPMVPISMSYFAGSCPILGLNGPPVPYINWVQCSISLNCTIDLSVSGQNVILSASNWSGNVVFSADPSPITVRPSPLPEETINLGPLVSDYLNGSLKETIRDAISNIDNYQFTIPPLAGFGGQTLLMILNLILTNPQQSIIKPTNNSMIFGANFKESTTENSNKFCFSSCLDNCTATSLAGATGTCFQYAYEPFWIPQVITGPVANQVYNRWLFNGVGWIPQTNQTVINITGKKNFQINQDNGTKLLYQLGAGLWTVDPNSKLITTTDTATDYSFGFFLASKGNGPKILTAATGTVEASIEYNNPKLNLFGTVQINQQGQFYLEQGSTSFYTNPCYNPFPFLISSS